MKINNLTKAIVKEQSAKNSVPKIETSYRAIRQAQLEEAFQGPEYWQVLQGINKKNTPRGEIMLKTVDASGNKSHEKLLVEINVKKIHPPGLNPISTYKITNGSDKIGYVKIEEKADGAYIYNIENTMQDKYSGIGKLADRIAVENCLSRGLKDFAITADATLNSHAAHYLAGKRFGNIGYSDRLKLIKRQYGTTNINKIVKEIIETTPPGEKYYTSNLKTVPMYLPKKLINEYTKLAQTNPIL